MRLTPVSLEVQGFKSFSALQTFLFPPEGSLGLITGQNEADLSMGQNGVGKSSLWSALHYCLFGEGSEGQKGNHLHNTDKKYSLQVVFKCKSASEPNIQIKREYKPIQRITLTTSEGEKVVSQEQLEEWLGVTSKQFLAAVMVPQFSSNFLDWSNSDQLGFLAELFQLSQWEKARQEALKASSETEKSIDKLNSEIDNFKFALTQKDKDIKALEQSSSNFEVEKASAKIACQQELDNNEKEMAQIEKLIASVSSPKEEVAHDKEKYESELKDVEAKLIAAIESASDVKASYSVLSQKVSSLKTLHGNGCLCPTCGTMVDSTKLSSELDSQVVQMGEVAEKMKEGNQNVEDLRKRISFVKGKISRIEQAIQAEKLAKINLQNTISRLELEKANILKMRDTIKVKFAGIDNWANPYTKLLEEAIKSYESLKGEFAISQQKYAEARNKHVPIKFWVRGFREIQTFLLKQLCMKLENACSHNLESLGFHGWRMAITIPEDSSETTSYLPKLFSVSFTTPEGTKRDLLDFSGGERQRLSLSCTFGIMDLLDEIAPWQFGMEIWDEPGQHLSEEGMSAFLSVLKQRALQKNKAVLFTDHRFGKYQEVDVTWKFIKTLEGTQITGGVQNA